VSHALAETKFSEGAVMSCRSRHVGVVKFVSASFQAPMVSCKRRLSQTPAFVENATPFTKRLARSFLDAGMARHPRAPLPQNRRYLAVSWRWWPTPTDRRLSIPQDQLTVCVYWLCTVREEGPYEARVPVGPLLFGGCHGTPNIS